MKIAIIGAGPRGLVTAYNLLKKILIIKMKAYKSIYSTNMTLEVGFGMQTNHLI